jgi:hypothetical protein
MVSIFLITLFLIDWGRGLYLADKTQTVAEAAVVSSMRIKADGLEAVAERWNTFGKLFLSGDKEQIHLRSRDWPTILVEAGKLRSAVGGYKGRIKAVASVVSEANGIPSTALQFSNEKALALEITPQIQTTVDEKGVKRTLAGAWYRRSWSPFEKNPEGTSQGEATVEMTVPVVSRLASTDGFLQWTAKRSAHGRVEWNVSLKDPGIQTRGNGGFPRTWSEALDGTSVAPYRFPYYQGERILHEE